MTVNFEIDGAVGVVTLAKPPHNLLDDALLEEVRPGPGARLDITPTLLLLLGATLFVYLVYTVISRL